MYSISQHTHTHALHHIRCCGSSVPLLVAQTCRPRIISCNSTELRNFLFFVCRPIIAAHNTRNRTNFQEIDWLNLSEFVQNANPASRLRYYAWSCRFQTHTFVHMSTLTYCHNACMSLYPSVNLLYCSRDRSKWIKYNGKRWMGRVYSSDLYILDFGCSLCETFICDANFLLLFFHYSSLLAAPLADYNIFVSNLYSELNQLTSSSNTDRCAFIFSVHWVHFWHNVLVKFPRRANVRIVKKVTIFIYFIGAAYNRWKDVFNGISSTRKFRPLTHPLKAHGRFGRPKFRARNIMSATWLPSTLTALFCVDVDHPASGLTRRWAPPFSTDR